MAVGGTIFEAVGKEADDGDTVLAEVPLAPTLDPRPDEERELDAAVTSGRFATGFSP